MTLELPGNRRRSLFTLMATLALCLLQLPASAQTPKSWLKMGEQLFAPGYLVSDNGAFYAQVRKSDPSKIGGGLAIFKGSGPTLNYGRIWGPPDSPAVSSDPYFMVVENSGNLCVYRGQMSTGNGIHWCSMQLKSGKDFYVTLQNDGNLCVYAGTSPMDNQGMVWCAVNHSTPITWVPNAKQFLNTSNSGPYGAYVKEALSSNETGRVFMTGSFDNLQTRWGLVGSAVHWGPDSRQCLTVNADNSVSLQACGGSATQTGWALASDGTLRRGQGCIDFTYNAAANETQPKTRKVVFAPQCPGTVKFAYQ